MLPSLVLRSARVDLYATFQATWGELLDRIKGYAEGTNPGPHWRE